jgi:hypothetical protein
MLNIFLIVIFAILCVIIGIMFFMFFYCRKILHIAIAMLIGVIAIFLVGVIVKLMDGVSGYYMVTLAYVLMIIGLLSPNLKYPPSKHKNKK